MDALTPMLRQYRQVKADHPDAILMFRLGDFYEMFFDDALSASKALSHAVEDFTETPALIRKVPSK